MCVEGGELSDAEHRHRRHAPAHAPSARSSLQQSRNNKRTPGATSIPAFLSGQGERGAGAGHHLVQPFRGGGLGPGLPRPAGLWA